MSHDEKDCINCTDPVPMTSSASMAAFDDRRPEGGGDRSGEATPKWADLPRNGAESIWSWIRFGGAVTPVVAFDEKAYCLRFPDETQQWIEKGDPRIEHIEWTKQKTNTVEVRPNEATQHAPGMSGEAMWGLINESRRPSDATRTTWRSGTDSPTFETVCEACGLTFQKHLIVPGAGDRCPPIPCPAPNNSGAFFKEPVVLHKNTLGLKREMMTDAIERAKKVLASTEPDTEEGCSTTGCTQERGHWSACHPDPDRHADVRRMREAERVTSEAKDCTKCGRSSFDDTVYPCPEHAQRSETAIPETGAHASSRVTRETIRHHASGDCDHYDAVECMETIAKIVDVWRARPTATDPDEAEDMRLIDLVDQYKADEHAQSVYDLLVRAWQLGHTFERRRPTAVDDHACAALMRHAHALRQSGDGAEAEAFERAAQYVARNADQRRERAITPPALSELVGHAFADGSWVRHRIDKRVGQIWRMYVLDGLPWFCVAFEGEKAVSIVDPAVVESCRRDGSALSSSPDKEGGNGS